jgi:hypothetical protein
LTFLQCFAVHQQESKIKNLFDMHVCTVIVCNSSSVRLFVFACSTSSINHGVTSTRFHCLDCTSRQSHTPRSSLLPLNHSRHLLHAAKLHITSHHLAHIISITSPHAHHASHIYFSSFRLACFNIKRGTACCNTHTHTHTHNASSSHHLTSSHIISHHLTSSHRLTLMHQSIMGRDRYKRRQPIMYHFYDNAYNTFNRTNPL